MRFLSPHAGGTTAGVPAPPVRSWAWIAWSITASLPLVGYFMVPASDSGATVQAVLYCLISVGAALALAAGIRLHRPETRSIWWLLAGGQLMYTGGDAAYFVATAQGDTSYPLLANILYLSQYVFIGVALTLLTRRRSPKRNAAAVIDTAIVAVGAAVLWWVFLVHPLTTVPGISAMDRLAATAYPVMDLCVLTVAIRLVLSGSVRHATYHLLLAFLGLILVADTAYGLQTLSGSFVNGSWPDALWLSSYVALGAAGLHPSMRRLTEPVESRSGATPYRLVLLGVATSMAPAVLFVQSLRGVDESDLVVVAASAALFLLVLIRMAGLIASQRRLAITDGLTGLYTRRFLSDNLRLESERAARHGTAVALLLIDVDHFKLVNDTYGHPAGDQVLMEVARRLQDTCRGTDVVARFGGEEFAVLMSGTIPDGLASLAERVRARMSDAPFLLDGRTAVAVTVSIGAAGLPAHTVSADELVSTADAALYAAKRGGRNRVVVGDSTARTDLPVPAAGADAAHLDGLDGHVQRWALAVGEAVRRRPDAATVPPSMVVSVCAAWAVMRTPRPGHPGLSAQHSRTELRRCRGVQFNPHVVDEFLALEAARVVGTPISETTPTFTATTAVTVASSAA